MKNSTLFSIETRFKDRFYCCLESLKGNFKFLLVFLLFMGSFTQGVSAQGTLVPACNLLGQLEACAVLDPVNDTSHDFTINIEVARSGAPNLGVNPLTSLSDGTFNNNFAYSFVSNSSLAFIRAYGAVIYNPVTNKTTQSLTVCPGSSTPEFNLQLNVTNTSSSPNTFCECSKSVSVSKVAATSSYSPILCYGQLSTLTAVGQFSDIGQYTYTLLPDGPQNSTGIFPGLAGSVAGITYTVNVESAEGCSTTTSQTITQPADNPVILNCPNPGSISACQSTDAITLAFNNWLNSFSFTGGTHPVLTRSPQTPTLPALCGGSRDVTWTVTDDCGQPQSCTRTFTITAPPAVVITQATSTSTPACSYADQAAATAAFNAWLAGFTVSGGCSPSGSYGQPQAPAYCGGATTVTYTVTDKCYQTQTRTATFTITAPPSVVITQATSTSTPACSYADQAAATAAFNAWLAGFTVSGGCSPSGSYGQPEVPAYCGGATTVTYTVTDKCYQPQTRTATFTITAPPAVVITQATSTSTSACLYADQAAATAAFNAWLAGFTVSGGCSPSGSYGQPEAPAYCGGATTVTYTVTDKCYQPQTRTATFTITAPPAVVITQATSTSTSACLYADQAAATAAFNAWLAGFTVSGGCSPSGSYGEPQAPAYCGGATTVTYTVTDKCYQPQTRTATFTITAPLAVVITQATSTSTSACIYADQAAATAAFNAWLAGFTVSGGCDPRGSFGEGTPTAPAYCGGATTVTYTVTDKCYQPQTRTATFTITAAPAVVITQATSTSTSACIYADQAAATAAFNAWLAGFTVSGGCSPSGSYGEPQAPAYCGGATTVTYTVTDKCYQPQTRTATFTITAPPAVVITQATSTSTSACIYADQAAATAAFNAWLVGFTVSGGCSPSGSYGEPQAPAYCGGTTTVTYTVTDKCYQPQTRTATFTITAPSAVVITQATSTSTSACIYADQAAATAAFNAWLSGFTVSGGCSPSGILSVTGSTAGGAPTAPAYCGGATTVTYTVTDKCYQPQTRTATFTITAPPAVVITQATSTSTSACIYADQAAATAAFNAWLAGFTVSGGCDPRGSFGEGTPTAPVYCGGATTVTYTVADKCYQPQTRTATFTITAPPAVVITQATSTSTSACIYADQAAATAAFNAWLAGFTVSGGCSPSGSYGQPEAPAYCGGARTVTYTVTDKCYQPQTRTATFTITAPPTVVITQATSTSTPACSYADQAAATAAFNAWLAGFTVSGGCSPSGSYGQPEAPAYCGGATTVTYTVTDKCYQPQTRTATFTITAPPAVVITSPANSTTPASTYIDQAAADAAFNAWLAEFTVSGGCSPSGSYGQPHAPLYCGGETTVTYTVTDKCFEPQTRTATFTITPSTPANINTPDSISTSACIYADQASADAAFAAWLAQFTVSGGINPHGSFGEGTPTAPVYCGGTTTVTYTVTDRCYEPIVIIKTFTITPPPAVVPHAPESTSTSTCTYADQAAADSAFATWLAQFSVNGGCSPSGILSVTGSTTGGAPTAPAYCGGTTSVTYTISDKCIQNFSITRIFIITPSAPVTVSGPENATHTSCDYASQTAVDSAYAAWLLEFTVSGGCSPTGTFGEGGAPAAPSYCGGERSVTYSGSDRCHQPVSITRTFTITPSAPVTVSGPENATHTSCDYASQTAVDSAYAAWLLEFTVSGGCSPTGTFGEGGAPAAPSYCGGERSVTYSGSDRCHQPVSITRTFTITPSAPVTVSGPENATHTSCDYANQAAVDSAYAAWLLEFTVSGGCSPTGTFGEGGAQQAPALCGGERTVTYSGYDSCHQPVSITRTFTVTAPAPVVVNAANNATYSACSFANQASADTAFTAWLTNITVSGGCAPIVTAQGHPVAPPVCGGSVCVTFLITDKCYTGSVTQIFTITSAPAVVVTQPENETHASCDYATQATVDTAFAAWLAQFTTTGGCSPNGSYGEPTAPSYCGGSREVTYTVTDKCYTTTTVTRTFTITESAAVTVSGPTNSSTGSCSYANQDAANAAFATWLGQFTVSGGCSPSGSFGEGTPTAPAYCGGTTSVTYTGSDRCHQGVSITRTFTITESAPVTVSGPTNSSTGACLYANQEAANAAFATWLGQFTVSGGCSPSGSFGEGTPTAPAYCGGTTSVTYTGSDRCHQGVSITRTFTITPVTEVTFHCGTDVNVPACSTQAQVNTAYAAFLASTTASGGCTVGTLTNNGPTTAPSACGGSVTVTWTYNVTGCGTSQSCTKTFTVAAPAPVVLTCGSDFTLPACSTQAQLNSAWTAFLNSTTAIGGCNGVLTSTTCSAPSLCGGYVDVTWTYTVSACGQQSGCGNNSNSVHCTKRFTVAAPAPVVLSCATAFTLPACSTQAQLNAAWTAFLNSTTATGGCNGVLTRSSCSAPSLCGGYVDVTWTYTVSTCGQQSGCGSNSNSVSCTKRFTVAAPAPVAISCGANVTVPACSTQAQLDAAWTAFLNSTTASGGCGGVLTRSTCSAPSLCGGYTDVTWTYTVATCGQQSGCGSTNSQTCTKRFTVAAPSPVVFHCGTDVTVAACSSQAQVTAAWNSFLASTTATGGCGGQLTRTQCSAPSVCGGYVDVTWTYSVASCGQQSGCGTGNSLTCTKRFTVLGTTPVQFTCGTDVTVPACSSQTTVTNAWNAFLASTTASGGCNGTFSRTSATTPSSCGGSVNVTWTYCTTACGGQTSTQTCTKTFTVAAPAPVVLTPGNNVTLAACSTQAQLNTAWTAFLNSTTATGGCSGVLTRSSCSAPSLCGGYVDVTWTYTVATCGQSSGCGSTNTGTQSQSITRRFTVDTPSPLTFNAGNNFTLPACSTQAELNSAWNTFLNSTTVTGGCNATLTRTSCSAPALCGGYVDVTWTATTTSCGQQSGCGTGNSQSITRRFTVAAPSQVVFACGNNVTVSASSTQAQITTAWNAFLASTTASGGCNATFSRTSAAMPTTCGQYVDVTWTYTVGSCGQQSGCGSSNSLTCTKRFTVGGGSSAVTINAGSNVCVPSCKTQAQVNALWATFIASTTASGGNGTLTNNSSSCSIPSACGGYADVTWTYTSSGCGQTTYTCGGAVTTGNTYTVTRRFTVTAGGGVDVSGPSNATYVNTSFSSQYAVNNAFACWLAQFTTVSNGCGSVAVFSGDCRVAPSWTTGGSVRVTYSITGNCNSDSVCATFTITRGATCRATAEVKESMTAKAYPNPFSENFNLDLTTSSVEKVGVAIYDMTGKLIEQREVNADEVSGLQIGDRFATGVYNVIVTQGSDVKTLRVIKR